MDVDEQMNQLADWADTIWRRMKVNLLVNYGWEWDLVGLKKDGLRSDEVLRLRLGNSAAPTKYV